MEKQKGNVGDLQVMFRNCTVYDLNISKTLRSYKHDSLVRPFPPGFLTPEKDKSFLQLQEAANAVPHLAEIDWKDTSAVDKRSIDLLKWVITPKKFQLKVTSKNTLKHISFLVGEEEKIFAKEPDFVFEVVYSKPEEVRFEQIRNDRDLLYAYHGSKTENFHSILRTGLRNNLNKVSLFGEGIYLSRDMRVCMNYSPISAGWQNSLLGTSLSCIAVCEIIDHPDVKCSVKRSLQNLHSEELRQRKRSTNLAAEAQGADDDTHEVKTLKTEKRRSYIKGSEGGQIPEKYYVVRNDDHVRVKYLIVHAPYADKTFIRELTSGTFKNQTRQKPSAFRTFVSRHKFFFVMLFYVVLLLIISIVNSKAFSKWWREFSLKGKKESVFFP